MGNIFVLSMIYFNENALSHAHHGGQQQLVAVGLDLAQFIKTAIDDDNLFVSSVCQSTYV